MTQNKQEYFLSPKLTLSKVDIFLTCTSPLVMTQLTTLINFFAFLCLTAQKLVAIHNDFCGLSFFFAIFSILLKSSVVLGSPPSVCLLAIVSPSVVLLSDAAVVLFSSSVISLSVSGVIAFNSSCAFSNSLFT